MRAAVLARSLALAGILATPALTAAAPTARAGGFAPPAASPTVTPAAMPLDVAVLARAVAPLATTGHDLVMTTRDSRLAGSVDPGARRARVTVAAGAIRLDEVVHGGRVWLKMDLGAKADAQFGIRPGRWMRLNPKALATDNNLPIRTSAADPIDMPGILRGVATVTRPDPHRFAGVLDLTKVVGHNRPDADAVARAGAAAKSAPYTLVTDARGRVTAFAVDTRAFDPGLSIQVAYSHYGAPAAIADPPAAVNAPQSVYAIVD